MNKKFKELAPLFENSDIDSFKGIIEYFESMVKIYNVFEEPAEEKQKLIEYIKLIRYLVVIMENE